MHSFIANHINVRAWNLVTGLALLSAGCGDGARAQEAGETGEAGGSGGGSGSVEGGPECVNANDCDPGYGCYAGVCEYWTGDGHLPYEPDKDCYSDTECAEFEICEETGCVQLGVPPPPCEGLGVDAPIPLMVDGEVIALAFADTDGDGREELVVVTTTELQVVQSGVQAALVTLREPAGPVTAAAAGAFGGGPGDDLLLLVNDVLVRHASDGIGGLWGLGEATPIGRPGLVGLLAGDFDGLAPTDLITWGGAGAFLERNGGSLTLSPEAVTEVAAFEFAGLAPGVALHRQTSLELLTLAGEPVVNAIPLPPGPLVLAAFVSGEQARYVTIIEYANLSLVRSVIAETGLGAGQWVISGAPERLLAGDLDGDGADELVYLGGLGAGLGIQYDPLGPDNCWAEPALGAAALAGMAALGDHDGDGDEELALVNALGELLLFDGG